MAIRFSVSALSRFPLTSFLQVLCHSLIVTTLAACGGGGGEGSNAGASKQQTAQVPGSGDAKAQSHPGESQATAHPDPTATIPPSPPEKPVPSADATPPADVTPPVEPGPQADTTEPDSPSPLTDPSTVIVASQDKTCGIANFQKELMRQLNAARASARNCGSISYPAAAPLSWNTKLFNAAAGHSIDMARNNYFSHSSLDGRSFDQRIVQAGYAWRSAGENIAAGQQTIKQVIDAWLHSPGHCATIMNRSFVDVGVACSLNPAARYKSYWTMDAAAPR